MEHTLIESFPQQLADETAFKQLLVPVKRHLEEILPRPGRYHLGVAEAALLGVARDRYLEMEGAIVAWAVGVAQHFMEESGSSDPADPEKSSEQKASGHPPGVPFAVTLRRRAHGKPAVILVREVKADLEERRGKRVETALRKKAPKLEAAKKEEAAVASLLILEADDIQLSNYSLVHHALKRASKAVEADGIVVPDWIYLVETDGMPFYLWILKGDGIPIRSGSYELWPARD